MRRLALALLFLGVLAVAQDSVVLQHVRAVTVQVLVHLEKYTRSLTWYQEVAADGTRGEWKFRVGEWSREPQRVVVTGTGVIVYSAEPVGTLILTNAHVVSYLVRTELLGSAARPLEEYRLEDLEISLYPPSVQPKAGARPFQQYYFKLPAQYVEIKHRPDQFYRVYARIVDYDLALDVALLQVVTPEGKPAAVWGLPSARFRDKRPTVGEEVLVCGAPLGLAFSLDRGRVNQVGLNLGESGGIVWNDQLKLDVAAAPGSSGSGVFDLQGELVGLLHGTLVYAGNYIRGGVLAIPADLIMEWLIWRGWSYVVFK